MSDTASGSAPAREKAYTIEDLVFLMARLRDPQTGCPWDLKQDFASIVPSTLEEVYEVVEAIEQGDRRNLQEELGDLLFQVVFYSQMAAEERSFDFADVVHGIVAKLVRRHPHVFPSGDLRDTDTSRRLLDDKSLHEQWERIKQEEKQQAEPAALHGTLTGIPAALPAVQRALKIQKKLAAVGFDWKAPTELFPVVDSELQEVRAATSAGNQHQVEEEIGDLLFAVVNLARHLRVDPESALRRANRKVQQRFEYVERELAKQQRAPAQASLEDMEQLWQQAKGRVDIP